MIAPALEMTALATEMMVPAAEMTAPATETMAQAAETMAPAAERDSAGSTLMSEFNVESYWLSNFM